MGKDTEIAWCDHTFNPVWGCRKISPGCDFCYAEIQDHRFGDHWSPGSEYKQMSPSYWHQPTIWNRNALKLGERKRVFCGSMCDWADSNIPIGTRDDLWDLIRATPMLDWLLLTKRANNIEKYLPDDWGSGYDNVWLGVTVENQKHGLPRIDILREIPAKIHFLSVEPLLEELGTINLDGIDSVIVGGESETKARPMHPDWVRALKVHCEISNTVFLFKQWGEWQDGSAYQTKVKHIVILRDGQYFDYKTAHNDLKKLGLTDTEYATQNPTVMAKVGKKKSGSNLDGIEVNEWPVGDR